MQIISVRLINYRCFKDSGEVTLNKFSVLIGKNDGGKTSFLKAVDKVLNQDSNFTSDDCWFEIDEKSGEETRAESLEVQIKLCEHNVDGESLEYHIRSFYSRSDNCTLHELSAEVVKDDQLNQDFHQMSLNELKILCNEYKAISITGPQNRKDTFINALEAYRMTLPKEQGWVQLPSTIVSKLPRVMLYESVEDAGPDKAITDSLNRYFKSELLEKHQVKLKDVRKEVEESLNNHAKSTMLNALSAHCKIVTDISIELDEKSFTSLNIGTVRITQPDGKTIDWDRIGAGKKREMALGIFRWEHDMLVEQIEDETTETEPTIILFDEPDINLDYTAQRLVNQLLQELAQKYPQTQVIVATHAVNMIDSVPLSTLNFFDDTYIPWRFEFGKEDSGRLETIRKALGLRNSALFNEKLVVVVEGETEMSALPPLFQNVTDRMLVLSGIYMINGLDKGQALKLATLLRKGGKNVILLLDSDCIDSKNKDSKKLGLALSDPPIQTEISQIQSDHSLDMDNHELSFLGDMEFEDMFSDEVWYDMLITEYSVGEDQDNWQLADIADLRNSEKFSGSLIKLIEQKCFYTPGKPEVGEKVAESAIRLDAIPKQIKSIFEHMVEKVN